MILRDYQQEIFNSVYSSTTSDLVQLDTGAGKTAIEAELCRLAEYAMIIAHRNVLITQCSATLAKFGVTHNTISSQFTRRRCSESHRATGRNYISRSDTNRFVSSIDSITSHFKRGRLGVDRFLPWLLIIDEAHHVTSDNKWGDLLNIFPNARVVGFTATPGRNDGASLSVRNGGLFERLVQCSWLKQDSIKTLINAGRLCPFSLYTPPALLNKWRSAGALEIATDPVEAYTLYMTGRRAIVMCPAIKTAKETAEKFMHAGISAASISSDMSGTDVWRIITMFSAGKIKVLCNVDMVGEGFDVPGVDGLIISRFTKSFIMYRQWIGRALRTSPGKSAAVIVDLVGVVQEHGEPDQDVQWDIDQPPKTPSTLRTHPCGNCGRWYQISAPKCPECGEDNELLRGKSVGSHYIKLLNIDTGLIAKARAVVENAQQENLRRTELQLPEHRIGSGLIGRLISKIRPEFAKGLLACGLSVYDVNELFSSNEKLRSEEFWTANFTAAHAACVSAAHAKKVYKKCHK